MLIRLSTTIEVELSGDATMDQAINDLRNAFREAGASYPVLTKFLVRQSSETELQIGLILDGANPEFAEDLANEIIAHVIDSAETQESNGEVSIERQDSSALAFA